MAKVSPSPRPSPAALTGCSARRWGRAAVDWSTVPVVMVGTPDPVAVQLIAESIREFEIKRLMAADKQETEP